LLFKVNRIYKLLNKIGKSLIDDGSPHHRF